MPNSLFIFMTAVLFIVACQINPGLDEVSDGSDEGQIANCTGDERQCTNNVVEQCDNGVWKTWSDCTLTGRICGVIEGKTGCYSKPDGDADIDMDTDVDTDADTQTAEDTELLDGGAFNDTEGFYDGNVKNVPTTISQNFRVMSSTLGRVSEGADAFKGVIKIEYLGTLDLSSVNANIAFYTKDDAVLTRDSTYLRNPAMRGLEASDMNMYHTLSVKNSIGYVLLTGELNIDVIARMDVEITASLRTLVDPYGHVSVVGKPYSTDDQGWNFDLVNDSDDTVGLGKSYVVLKDKNGNIWNWNSLGFVGADGIPRDPVLAVKEKGTLVCPSARVDYLGQLLSPESLLLDWSVIKE